MPARRADDITYTLLSNGSSTGAAVPIRGGEYLVYFEGTLAGGAQVSLQAQSPNGTWMDVEVFTANPVRYSNTPRSQTGIDLPACNVRCALTGGSASGIYAYLVGLG